MRFDSFTADETPRSKLFLPDLTRVSSFITLSIKRVRSSVRRCYEENFELRRVKVCVIFAAFVDGAFRTEGGVLMTVE